ncbi:unnamed protein product [Pleuronectes platessa]|uniref:Uncharacterized protein n=1 Tax=Pleuronectes platessa TaxID=8262 RepID=A0A9N7U5S8_PLEPL|nr:unnamed protein product [Pleuronectes platessa]
MWELRKVWADSSETDAVLRLYLVCPSRRKSQSWVTSLHNTLPGKTADRQKTLNPEQGDDHRRVSRDLMGAVRAGGSKRRRRVHEI